MTKLVWRVKLVAEQQPGAMTETELARIEREEQAGLAELGLNLAEAKRLTAAAPKAQLVPARMTALGACPRACMNRPHLARRGRGHHEAERAAVEDAHLALGRAAAGLRRSKRARYKHGR